jgi:hypothetical protein
MQWTSNIQGDSKLLSAFQFINDGNTDSNLESLCILCETGNSYLNILYVGLWLQKIDEAKYNTNIHILTQGNVFCL